MLLLVVALILAVLLFGAVAVRGAFVAAFLFALAIALLGIAAVYAAPLVAWLGFEPQDTPALIVIALACLLAAARLAMWLHARRRPR